MGIECDVCKRRSSTSVKNKTSVKKRKIDDDSGRSKKEITQMKEQMLETIERNLMEKVVDEKSKWWRKHVKEWREK